jgi:hypothetical protein
LKLENYEKRIQTASFDRLDLSSVFGLERIILG